MGMDISWKSMPYSCLKLGTTHLPLSVFWVHVVFLHDSLTDGQLSFSSCVEIVFSSLKLKALLLEVLVLTSGVRLSNPQEDEQFDLWWSGSSRNWTSLPVIIFLFVKFPFAVHHVMHRSREWNVLKSSFLFCSQESTWANTYLPSKGFEMVEVGLHMETSAFCVCCICEQQLICNILGNAKLLPSIIIGTWFSC